MSEGELKANFTDHAKNNLIVEWKRCGIAYAHLAENIPAKSAKECERNLANKTSRGRIAAAFFMMFMEAIGTRSFVLKAA